MKSSQALPRYLGNGHQKHTTTFSTVGSYRNLKTIMTTLYPCPCCGFLTFEEPSGSYDICPICFWEDDLVQLAFPDMAGGANKCSLIEGQRNFASFGACERRLIANARPPRNEERRAAKWRPLDPDSDRHLHWNSQADTDLWQTVKNSRICLYYWQPEYWLN
jgi:hypothetical protein